MLNLPEGIQLIDLKAVHARRLRAVALIALAHVAASSTLAAQQKSSPAPVRITWMGHAAFEIISSGGTRLLIDPWIGDNPATPAAFKDSTRYSMDATRPAAILVTHAHGDHDADVARLARVSNAKVIATGDHIEAMKMPDGHYSTINIGGTQRVGDIDIYAVPAMHSVTPGHALGYVLRFADGRTLYDTGDTWIFGEMSLIEKFFHPSIILIASGGGRAGEDPAAAAEAIRMYFHPDVIVPMHWGALPPPFAVEADVRLAFGRDKRAHILVPGVEVKF
jgi:L-ascorbate metabolism protein UlaG (beta-lactamase superfamily)